MRLLCLTLTLAVAVRAAEHDYSAARAAQEASAEKQRVSARAQEAALAARLPSTFFTPVAPPLPPELPCDRPADSEIRQMVDAGAKRAGLDLNLVRAVVRRESAYNPCAVSVKGAQGLMQLMPSVQTQFGVTNPYDPGQNIDAGTRLLKQLLNQFGGDLPRALGAYNAGAARVEQWGGIPPFPETMNYVSGILDDISPKQGVAAER